MSRLALKSHTKPAKFGALAVPKQGTGVSQQQSGERGAPGSGRPGGGGGGGSGSAAPARASPAVSSDSWASSSSDDEQSSVQQENLQQQQQRQQQRTKHHAWQSKHPGAAVGSAQQQQQQQEQQPPGLPARTPTPAAPLSARKVAQQQIHPISELYDISDSGSDGDADFREQTVARTATTAAKRAHRAGSVQPTPAVAALPPETSLGCPICGDGLQGLGLDQRQRHVNACCDTAAAPGSAGAASLPHPQQQLQQLSHQVGPVPETEGTCQKAQVLVQGERQQQRQQGQQEHAVPVAPAAAVALPSSALQLQQQQPALAAHRQVQPLPPAQQQQQEQQCCKVCGAGLSHLAVQQQVVHVKACMAGRGRVGKPGKQQQPQLVPLPLQQPQQQQHVLPPPQQPQQQQASGHLRHMDIGQWLKALGLERYHAVFVEQEVDLTCVHAVSADELASIGVSDRMHQVRIIQAAQALASELGLRQPRAGAGVSSKQPGPAAKRQKQLTLLPAAAAAAAAGIPGGSTGDSARGRQLPGGGDNAQQQQQHQQQQQGAEYSFREAGPRPHERALLSRLYPEQQGQQGQGQGQRRLTPQLAGGRTLTRGTPAGATSLWAGAAACQPVGPTLGVRLAQREAADPEAVAARRQPLARGGTAYPAGEESRALKRVRLEALKEELRTHEETVAGLRAMIVQLEKEVCEGAGPAPGSS